jgi:acyl carrier protein
MENFESLISEALEVDSVNMTDELISFDSWDSLTILSIIAVVSEEYNVELGKDEIENSKTIGGLKELIDSRL